MNNEWMNQVNAKRRYLSAAQREMEARMAYIEGCCRAANADPLDAPARFGQWWCDSDRGQRLRRETLEAERRMVEVCGE